MNAADHLAHKEETPSHQISPSQHAQTSGQNPETHFARALVEDARDANAPDVNAVFGADGSFALHIVNTIRESLLVLDGDLRVLIANRAFYQTFATEKSATEGCLLFELGDGQWNIAGLRELLLEVLPRDRGFDNFEVQHFFPGIGEKTMLLNARRLDGNAQGPRILLALEDITARKTAEIALGLYVKKLEWSNRELQDFAYIASHDLQEPLRAIQAFSERLSDRCGESLSPEGVDYLRRVQEAATRMRGLIHDLLAFSRVTTKARPFALVDLNAVAHAAVSDLARRIEETGGRIEIGALPHLEADATQMRQLLQNLIDNALKFHRDGEKPRIRLFLDDPTNESTGNSASDSACDSSAAACEIVVEDNGIGLDPKYADRIFTPFQRLHSQRKYPGSGIGLAICRKIAERHHGTLSVHSVPGKGSRFHLILPLQQPVSELLFAGATLGTPATSALLGGFS